MKCPICESEVPDERLPTVALVKLKPDGNIVLSCPHGATGDIKARLGVLWQKLMPGVAGITLRHGRPEQLVKETMDND